MLSARALCANIKLCSWSEFKDASARYNREWGPSIKSFGCVFAVIGVSIWRLDVKARENCDDVVEVSYRRCTSVVEKELLSPILN